MQTILEQDDAAPDSLEYFDKRFEELVGITRQEFTSKAEKRVVDGGYSVFYKWQNYQLETHADWPYWVLSEI